MSEREKAAVRCLVKALPSELFTPVYCLAGGEFGWDRAEALLAIARRYRRMHRRVAQRSVA